jgi:hypothetical protein
MANMDNPIVLGMCATARHDWGLDKKPGELTSGLHPAERQRLYDEMYQLYKHNVLPEICKLKYEIDGMIDEVATLKAENAKLMSELRFARDQVQSYQNNGNFY